MKLCVLLRHAKCRCIIAKKNPVVEFTVFDYLHQTVRVNLAAGILAMTALRIHCQHIPLNMAGLGLSPFHGLSTYDTVNDV